ncbi:AAA domain-containing protein [Algoriphagus sp. A40]|uniref:AAA domain-containing protein n=1 Tax=Algoriphagus sp. A40 TaxID=1945863 RepID=UPI0009847ADE|nr:AAA domain-containing protein [Algoriphagus sp. A40]OOG78051.1 DNA-binding protein [Algoriphagus sp. A40]
MPNIIEELKQGLKLLKLEWSEDLAQYKKKFLNTSLADKKKEGITWHPIQLKKSKIGMGERLLVEVERLDSNYPSAFSSGKSVTFFSTHEGYQGAENRVNGVVNQAKKDSMVVTLQADELPEWMQDTRLGVDLLFDEASYREMESALKKVIAGENPRLAELRDIALGEKSPKFRELPQLELTGLNFSQNLACQKIAEAQDFAIVHGPPGTGKTTTLIAAISQAVERGLSILVTAPSNAAVDLMVEKLVDAGISTLRLGHPARVEEKILNQTLDAKIAFHDSYRDLKKLRKETEAYLKIAQQYKRHFGPEERAQRKLMYQEVSRSREAAGHLEDYIRSDIFQKTQVFACTLVGASSFHLKGMLFDVVFIDEAAQGLEAATWIPILKAKKVVFAGDHCQLPPTIKSFEASKAGLSVTLFEKIIQRQPQTAQMLQVQYRMPEDIMGFSNGWFYEGKLQAAENTKTHAFSPDEPVLEWIDTAGSGFTDQVEAESLSTFNPDEARFACTYLNDTIKRIGFARFKQENLTIGLIAPYSAQVRMLRNLIFDTYEFPNLKAFADLITIDTVDGFQGQERDLMLISLTRSNDKGEIGFLSDTRRMNVALTRAKRKLILIGDSGTLAQNPFFDSLLRYFEAKGAYRSVYEFL